MAIAKKCTGCQSNKRIDNVSYYNCKENIHRWDTNLHKIFRDHFCPCVTCLVKATCTDPKLSRFGYTLMKDNSHHKCELLFKQREKFKKEVGYDKRMLRLLS